MQLFWYLYVHSYVHSAKDSTPMSIFDQFRFSFVFGGLDVCQRILSDRPVSSNIWQSGQAVIVLFCARVYRVTEQLSYVRFVQRRKPILETVVLRYLAKRVADQTEGS